MPADKPPRKTRMDPLDPQPIAKGECDHCGQPVPEGKIYCCAKCRVAYGNILARQGKCIMQAAKIWRRYRGRAGTPGQGKLAIMAARIDEMNVEDRLRKKRMREKAQPHHAG